MESAAATSAGAASGELHLRPATAADGATIKAIVRAAGVNPIGLYWPRFLIAEAAGKTVAIGQIKIHGDGSHELASIAVLPEWRGRGVASQIIRALLANERGPLYLTCRPELESFYSRFGFQIVKSGPLPPYFKRIALLVNSITWLTRQRPFVLIMFRAV